jgi:hypothetical protein
LALDVLLPANPSSNIAISFLFCIINFNYKMASNLAVQLTAPNGRQYTQPTGLFINNEWVASSDGKKISSINPTYDLPRIR